VLVVWSVRVAVMATPVIMSASLLLVADMGLQAGAAVVLVGGFGDGTWDGVDGLAVRGVLCGFRESSWDGWGLVMIEEASNVVQCIHIHNEMQASGGWDALCMHMQNQCQAGQCKFAGVLGVVYEISGKPAMQQCICICES
jgi:hypothetical protein